MLIKVGFVTFLQWLFFIIVSCSLDFLILKWIFFALLPFSFHRHSLNEIKHFIVKISLCIWMHMFECDSKRFFSEILNEIKAKEREGRELMAEKKHKYDQLNDACFFVKCFHSTSITHFKVHNISLEHTQSFAGD